MVIGMMGQMQGMTRARSPPINPTMKMYHSEWLAMLASLSNACSCSVTGCHQRLSVLAVTGATALSAGAMVLSATTGAAASATSAAAGSVAAATAGDLPLFLSATSPGGRQFSSLHTPYSR